MYGKKKKEGRIFFILRYIFIPQFQCKHFVVLNVTPEIKRNC
jgi:hypothetical protein